MDSGAFLTVVGLALSASALLPLLPLIRRSRVGVRVIFGSVTVVGVVVVLIAERLPNATMDVSPDLVIAIAAELGDGHPHTVDDFEGRFVTLQGSSVGNAEIRAALRSLIAKGMAQVTVDRAILALGEEVRVELP